MQYKKIFPMCLIAVAILTLSSCGENLEVRVHHDEVKVIRSVWQTYGNDCETYISVENTGSDVLNHISLDFYIKEAQKDKLRIGSTYIGKLLIGDTIKVGVPLNTRICPPRSILDKIEINVSSCSYGKHTCKDTVKIYN